MGSISGVDRPIKTLDHRGGANRFSLRAMDRRAPAERTNSADSARAEVKGLRAALAAAEAKVSDAQVQVAALKLMIEKLRRALYGRRSELLRNGCSGNWSSSSTNSPRAPPRTILRPRRRRGVRPRSRGSSGAGRLASPSPSICRASVWWYLRPHRGIPRTPALGMRTSRSGLCRRRFRRPGHLPARAPPWSTRF